MTRARPSAALPLALAVLLAATPLRAQSRLQVELAPFGGETFFLHDGPSSLALERPQAAPQIIEAPRFQDTWSAGLTAGLRLSDRFGVEGLMTWTPTWLIGSNFENGTDVYAYTCALSGVAHGPAAGRLHPFAGAGVGGELDDYSGSIHSHAHWLATVQGGLALELGDGRSVRVIARDFLAPYRAALPGGGAGWQNDVMVSAGVTWRIPLHRQPLPRVADWKELGPTAGRK